METLNYFKDLTKKYFAGKAFVWAVNFRIWETSSIIQKELYTNIGLAFAAVFVVTLLLVANLWACILVCVCVVVTLVSISTYRYSV